MRLPASVALNSFASCRGSPATLLPNAVRDLDMVDVVVPCILRLVVWSSESEVLSMGGSGVVAS
jgi:hypothetical protein